MRDRLGYRLSGRPHANHGACRFACCRARLVEETGYADPDFNPANVTVLSSATPMVQSSRKPAGEKRPDAPLRGVNATVFGYACRHTQEMLPLSIVLAHRLARRLTDARLRGELTVLHPDGQAQVAVRYRSRAPESVEGVTLFRLSTRAQRIMPTSNEKLRELVVKPVLDQLDTAALPRGADPVNPPELRLRRRPHAPRRSDGRKNDIDTYGGYCRHGGAALSGKDPSRIDRSGAYLARYAAKNVVASGLAHECEVQVSYAMGRARAGERRGRHVRLGRVPEPRNPARR